MCFKFRAAVLGLLLVMASGCASDGSFVNPFDSSSSTSESDGGYQDTSSTGSQYYFAEFPDVPVPNDMSEKTSSTFVTFAPSGEKCGVQEFSGRYDAVSLMNTLRKNMADNGWTLRSMLRSKESVLVFDKQERVCSIVINDGLIYTSMKVYMSTRLQGDGSSGGGSTIPAYSPKTPAGAVAVPPAGGKLKLSE